jgi:hypothetical protein
MGQHGSRSDGHGIGAQSDGLHHIGAVADGAAGDDGDMVADAFLTQPLCQQRQGPALWESHIVPRLRRGGTRSGAQTVDGDDVCAAAGNAAGNGGNVVYGGYFDKNRLAVSGGLFQGINQLSQVFDGVDVMVGRRGNGIGPFGNHAGPGNIPDVFAAG